MRKLHLVYSLALVLWAALTPAAHACGNDEDHQLPPPMPDPIREVINGEVYTHTRAWDENRIAEMRAAINTVKTLVASHPGQSWMYWDNLALSLIRTGRAAEALAVLDDKERYLASVQLDDSALRMARVWSHGNRGTAWLALGDEESALASFQAAIAADPEAHGGREWAHIQLMRYELNVERYPALASADFLGVKYRATGEGRVTAARELAETLADLISNGSRPEDDRWIYFTLGRALEAGERKGDASFAYRRAEVLGHPHAGAALDALGAAGSSRKVADGFWERGQQEVRRRQTVEVASLTTVAARSKRRR